jgi:hypothetical protein
MSLLLSGFFVVVLCGYLMHRAANARDAVKAFNVPIDSARAQAKEGTSADTGVPKAFDATQADLERRLRLDGGYGPRAPTPKVVLEARRALPEGGAATYPLTSCRVCAYVRRKLSSLRPSGNFRW